MDESTKYRIIIPTSNEELEKYYHLRYEILRKKWGQEEGTTRDEWEDQSVHIMMVDENNNAVGAGRLQINSPTEGQIRSMAIADDHQGKGLGSRILKFLEDEAVKRKLTLIILDARENAVNFYLKNGYAVEGRSYVLFDIIPHFKMSKIIGA